MHRRRPPDRRCSRCSPSCVLVAAHLGGHPRSAAASRGPPPGAVAHRAARSRRPPACRSERRPVTNGNDRANAIALRATEGFDDPLRDTSRQTRVAARAAPRDTEGGAMHMRARIRFIAPLVARRVALDRGLRGVRLLRHRRRRRGSSGAASGDACAPVAGDQLVVLEDDKAPAERRQRHPGGQRRRPRTASPALLPALNAVSAALTTDDLVDMNAAVDVERQERRGRRRRLGRGERRHRRPRAGQRPDRRRRGRTSPSRTILANVYADVLKAAGFDATVAEVGSRELYLEALEAGTEIQVVPRVPGHRHRVHRGRRRHRGRQRRRRRDARGAEAAGRRRPVWSSATRPRPPTRTPSPSPQEFADKLGVTTLSELADACGDGSLILGGPAGVPDPAVLPAGPRGHLRPEVRQLPGAATPVAR